MFLDFWQLENRDIFPKKKKTLWPLFLDGVQLLVLGQKIPFWASFLNYTGSVKRTANLAYVFIPKGETNKTSNYLKGKSNKMLYIKMSPNVKCYQILWEIPETLSFR